MIKRIPKILAVIGSILVLISTVGLIIFVPVLNDKIENLQQKTNQLNEKLDAYSFNYIMEANQKVKMASTHGAYKILESINSTFKKEFEDHLRRQLYQGIVILRNKQLNNTEIENLNKIGFNDLEKIYEKESDFSINEYGRILDELKINEEIVQKRLNFRFLWTVIFGIIQVFGLFLVIIADYLKSDSHSKTNIVWLTCFFKFQKKGRNRKSLQ